MMMNIIAAKRRGVNNPIKKAVAIIPIFLFFHEITNDDINISK